MPRIVLVDNNGNIVFIGHPKKLNIKDALETLIKGDNLQIDPLLLQEDKYSAPEPATSSLIKPETETESSSEFYRADLSLTEVKEEMKNFVTALKNLTDENLKNNFKGLDTDCLIINRETKLSINEGKFLTKYTLVNNLVGPEQTMQEVCSSLSVFIEDFHGSFNVKWSTAILV